MDPTTRSFENIIRRRTEQALAAQQAAFPAEHDADADEALLEYVRQWAKELGRIPNACEILGGSYLTQRFGNWDRLLRLAGLPKPGKAPKWERRLLVRREWQRQAQLFREERQARKEKKLVGNCRQNEPA